MRKVGNFIILTQGLLLTGARTGPRTPAAFCPRISPLGALLPPSRRQMSMAGSAKKSLAEWSFAPAALATRLPLDPETDNAIRRNVPGAIFSKGEGEEIF